MLLAAHIIQKKQEKAIAKGLELAYKDAANQNAAYYRRMRTALEAGELFDEPPPMFRRNRQ